MNGLWTVSLLLLALACGGCHHESEDLTVTPIFDPGEPTQAQPKLQTMKLYIGNQEMLAELALTAEQERTGMMFRTNMEENAGMLFIMDQPRQAAFWMKNCTLPLSIAYIDSDGVIKEIHDLEPHNTNSVLSATGDIRFALETPRGWFERHHVGAGTAIATDRGTLQQTFFGKSQ